MLSDQVVLIFHYLLQEFDFFDFFIPSFCVFTEFKISVPIEAPLSSKNCVPKALFLFMSLRLV